MNKHTFVPQSIVNIKHMYCVPWSPVVMDVEGLAVLPLYLTSIHGDDEGEFVRAIGFFFKSFTGMMVIRWALEMRLLDIIRWCSS